MSSPHSAEHEATLTRLVSGELSLDDPAVRELQRTCEPCRAEIEELREMADTLNELANEDRARLENAQREATASDEAMVQRAMEDLWRAEGASSAGGGERSWAFRLVPLVAAAAAAIMLLLVVQNALTPDLPPQWLNHSEELVQPIQEVDDFRTFEWQIETSLLRTFSLRIYNEREAGGRDLDPAIQITGLDETSYTLTDAERALLGRSIYWEVEQSGTDGQRYFAYAWLPR